VSDPQKPNSSVLAAELSDDGSILTVAVPLTIRRHGGRKRIITLSGEPDWAPRPSSIDSVLVKALARAFRWKGLIERGNYHSISDVAAAEQISEAYIRRLLRLTLLAPPLVEAIVDGRLPSGVQLEGFRGTLPVVWSAQKEQLQKMR
jgi:hypothetical protein